uniref:Uncharacterized protein n=1 Tax=Parascaris univalens TaxID=6257 RepID=A0A915CIH3_PARUN
MDIIKQLLEQYKLELDAEVSRAKQWSVTFQDDINKKVQFYQQHLNNLQPLIETKKGEMMNLLLDQSPTEQLDIAKLMATFIWTGVLLLTTTIGGVLGGTILKSILSLFVSGFYAFLAAYMLLPAMAWYYLQQPADNDRSRRHALLAFSLLEGLATGFVLSERALTGPPPLAAITPLVIGFGAQMGASFIAIDRKKLLGVTLGGGLLIHLSLGVIVGVSLPYLLLSLLYTAIGFVAIQHYIKHVKKETAFTHEYQLSFVLAVLMSQALIYFIFGGDPNEMAARSADTS